MARTQSLHHPDLRMERRWSQRTPANLWRLRVTGIALIGAALWVMSEFEIRWMLSCDSFAVNSAIALVFVPRELKQQPCRISKRQCLW
jgi:hypothetical protein